MTARFALFLPLLALVTLAACDSNSSDFPDDPDPDAQDSVVVTYTVDFTQRIDKGALTYTDSLGTETRVEVPRTRTGAFNVRVRPPVAGDFTIRIFGITSGSVRLTSRVSRNGRVEDTDESTVGEAPDGLPRDVDVSSTVTVELPATTP